MRTFLIKRDLCKLRLNKNKETTRIVVSLCILYYQAVSRTKCLAFMLATI